MAASHPVHCYCRWLRNPVGYPCVVWEHGRRVDPLGVRLKTQLVDGLSTVLDRKTRLGGVRKMIFTPSERKMAPGHSHPRAAALRADASVFLSKLATALGRRRYDVSIAARERRGLATGPRQLRSAKDLLSDSSQASLFDSDFVTMVDTDYYMSEGELSAYAGHDIGIYSLRPDNLAGRNEESSWSYTTADTITEEVAGGAQYTHKVWDWGGDMTVLGRGWSTYVYDIVQFPVGPARTVTALVLARVISLPLFVAQWLYPDVASLRPRRMVVEQQGRFLVGSFGPPTSQRVCVKAANSPGTSSVSISPDTYQALGTAARIPNTDRKIASLELLPSAVERLTKAMGEDLSTAGCYLLSDMFSTAYKAHNLVNYQSCGKLLLEDGKPTAVLAAVPLFTPGCAPTSSHNNEARAVKARVEDVANSTPFTPELRAYGLEFSERVVTRPHRGVPWSIEELRESQTRPTQRARRLQEEKYVADGRTTLTTSSFQKTETYPKISDPRLINQVSTDHTNRLCSFAGAFKEVLGARHNKHWNMVGKNPTAIARSLHNLQAATGSRLAGGDYSRMDGRTSVAYRQSVLEPSMLRFFHPKYHTELIGLLRKEEKATTWTKGYGVHAKMAGANLSGSGLTTILNTLDSSFNEYAARRQRGESPEDAFRHLGCYFGDDSAVADDVFDATTAVASSCGMKLEREEVPGGSSPGYVVFLSRVYPDIRTSQSSHPCITRCFGKICVVMAPPGSDTTVIRAKLRLKTEGMLLANSHVPVLREYTRALNRVYQLDAGNGATAVYEELKKTDSSYRTRQMEGPYPFVPGDEELLLVSVATSMGITPEEASLTMNRLDSAVTEQDLSNSFQHEASATVPSWARWVPTCPVAI